ncbi:unnamed protein product [Polarella glacialis]|uniref:Uncharacterized protein n=1 Tax=Polarella glacialis TaxID=89957 RepID=A0A813DJZ5_POLGL|nr:unnamed protein product [Polarella glacialis]
MMPQQQQFMPQQQQQMMPQQQQPQQDQQLQQQQQQAMMMYQHQQAQAMMMMQQQQMMQQAMMGWNPMAMAMMGGGAAPLAGDQSHQSLEPLASPERKKMAHRIDENGDESSGDEIDIAKGLSNSVHHPHYRPPDMEIMSGVTDRRFEGHIHRWFEDQGFGFVNSEEVTKKFSQDAFLHRTQKKHFDKGEYVTFAVFLNYRGKPQATELRKCNKKNKPPPPS